MSARTRVVIADHHPLVRASLRRLLDSIDEFEVVGEAGNGIALLELAQRLQPGLVLVDMSMPDLNGLDATARLIGQDPDIRVIVLSMHLHEEYVRQTLRLGAQGYLLKDAAPVELELAMQAAIRGETYLSSAVSGALVGDYLRRLRSDEPAADTLTPRQREVLQLIAEGHSTKEIARRLDLSVKTVETHRAQLMRQLDIHEIAGLVRYAMRNGIISDER